jgi:nitroreductase
MEVFESIVSRHSVRSYEKKDVPNEFIGQMLEAAIRAPSAGNVQPWEFIVVKDFGIKKELASAALKQKHIDEAPVIIVVCANPEKSADRYGERGKSLYCIQDTAAAIENMLLVANSLGLGTCWIGAFEEDKVRNILNIPQKLKPVALITVGFPFAYQKPTTETVTSRIPFESITSINKYGEKFFPWIHDYGDDWKYKLEPLETHIERIKKRISEKGNNTKS